MYEKKRAKRRWEKMKKLFLVLALIFSVLGFAGAIYVLSTGGEANAGYAVIPLVFSLIFQQALHQKKK